MAVVLLSSTLTITFISLAARSSLSTRKTLSTRSAIMADAFSNMVSGIYPTSTSDRSNRFQPSLKNCFKLSDARKRSAISMVKMYNIRF